jgi:RNA polymerase sigma factor (sigma-70 family)
VQPLSTDSIAELVVQARTGDERATEQLLRAIRPTVVRACGRFLPNAADAEEAAQDTLLAIATSLASFEGRSTFSTWVHQIAANRSRSTYRSLARRSTVDVAMPERSDPRTTSVIAGTRLDLLEGLERLDPQLAEPLALRDVLGLDYAAIAAALRLPEGTVKSRIHQARQAIQRYLIDASTH